jgi:hypothetical protein
VQDAFNAWTVPDTVTGLKTSLNFVADFGTAVVGFNTTIEKSRDLSRVERFSEITAFPREPWTETVAELNDYILMPAEDGRPDSLLPSSA